MNRLSIAAVILFAPLQARATTSQTRLQAASAELGGLDNARTAEASRGTGDDIQRVLEGGRGSASPQAVQAAAASWKKSAPSWSPAERTPQGTPPPPSPSRAADLGRGAGTVVGALPGTLGGLAAALPQAALLNAAISSHALLVLGGAGLITGGLGLAAAVVGGAVLAYYGAKFGGKAGAAFGGAIAAIKDRFGRR